MEEVTQTEGLSAPYTGTKKDYQLGLVVGIIIGLLVLPILKNANPGLYDTLFLFIVPFFALGVPLGLIVASLIAKKIPLVWQLAKFLVIGVMNTLVDIGVLALITLMVTSDSQASATWFTTASFVVTYYSLYKGFSFIVANINSFFWNKYWTFGSVSKEGSSRQFLQFFVVSIVGFAINVVVASLVFSSLLGSGALTDGQAGLVGAVAGSALGLIWNFVGYNFFVFKK